MKRTSHKWLPFGEMERCEDCGLLRKYHLLQKEEAKVERKKWQFMYSTTPDGQWQPTPNPCSVDTKFTHPYLVPTNWFSENKKDHEKHLYHFGFLFKQENISESYKSRLAAIQQEAMAEAK